MLFVYTTCLAQAGVEPALINYKKSSFYNTNYNGPLRSAQWYYICFNEEFVQRQFHILKYRVREDIMEQSKDVMGWGTYKEFDKLDRLIKTVRMDKDKSYFEKSELDLKTSTTYMYDEQDWNKKQVFKVVKKQSYPVYDQEFIIQPHYKTHLGNSENIHESKFDYILDDQQRVIKGIYFRSVQTDYSEVQGLDENAIKRIEDEFAKRYSVPFIEATYNYDARGNVNRLNIQTKQQRPIPFHFLGTETAFCPDLHVSYEYDSKDRMTQLTYIGCNDTLAFEKYAYEPQKDYINKRTRFIASALRSTTHKMRTMAFYHNENGDIIQKEYVKERAGQTESTGYMVLPESIYYKYEYDKYNIWIKCYIYMEGKPEDSEPTAIAQRDLEYYDN